MQFEHPHYLWSLLVAVPAMVAFFWWAAREKRRIIESFISARLLPGLLVGVSPGRRRARVILLLGAVSLIIAALARPQLGFSWEEARSRGLDIVVAIDTSRSMLATDVAPNRLRRAQLSALDLKRLARTDRLGLVAFAGGAFLQCPLTLDDAVFRQSVDALDVNIIPQGGTALAEAIDAAKGAFKEGNDNHKVLVLFTDGEDHDGNAMESAKAAAKEGMRIFTVGVGTANGELLRTTDVSGRNEFIKDSEGNAVKSRLNEGLLREVAQETGGFYLPLSGANTMNLLYERGLAPLPKGDLASQRIKRHHERFQWLLGLAIVLLLIEVVLPERKDPKAAGAPAAAVPLARPVAAKAVVIAVMLAVPSLALAGPSGALKRYQGGDYGRALEEYERSLKSKPDDPRLHYNAGAAAFQNRDYDQALEHLNSALVTEDVALQQRAYYNIGNTKFRQGEALTDPKKKQQLWEQAIKSFDSALTLNPKDGDSEFNKEFVKKKLEELKQQQQQQQQDQNKDDKNNKDDQKDQKDQKDQQSKDQQSKDQQKQDQKDQQKNQQQQNQDKDKQGQDQQKKDEQQKKQDDASKQQQDQGGEKKPDQAQQQQQEGEDGQPQQMRGAHMTPQQAAQLLEAIKGEEKLMTFKPVLKSNRTDRVFKDW